MNDAYRVLRDPVARVEYLLEIEGARKEGEHKQQAPPELLEEVFELNESLDELREAKESGGDLAALKSRLESAEKNFQEKARRSRRAASGRSATMGRRARRERRRQRPQSNHGAAERIAESPLVHSESGEQRSKGIDSSALRPTNMGRIVGIDLGTTNSLVAYTDPQTGAPKCIPGPNGSTLCPRS